MNLIETAGLRREFGHSVAVRDVSLEVREGAVLALVGPNGAGKTTLLRMIAGLLEPTRGTAVVAGRDVRREPREVHARLGYLPDLFGLYEDLTVAEYLEYFARAHALDEAAGRRRARESLIQVGLGDHYEAPIASLSRGMRQRAGLARTLLHDPPLLLLDEPASGLDPEARRELQLLFRGLARAGKTLVVSSHILTELEDYCTDVAILQKGRLVAAGPVEEVSRSAGVVKRVRVRASAAWERLAAALSEDGQVGGLNREDDEAVFQYAGDERKLAALLRRLVEGGIEVSYFGEERGTIQDAYLAWLERGR